MTGHKKLGNLECAETGIKTVWRISLDHYEYMYSLIEKTCTIKAREKELAAAYAKKYRDANKALLKSRLVNKIGKDMK